jgi:hypothetical protein
VGGFSDGVVVVAGTAIDVFGPFSSTESVIVAHVVISDVVTGPGGAGSGVSAALMSLNASPIAPMATAAQEPTPADTTFNSLEITSDHSKSVSV